MGLAAFDGPQLLILDEPTNHLDIDSRGELIEAINEYEGACVIVSHDRRLLEACVDRLWLVADGTVKAFEGDVADYSRLVLAQRAPDARPPRAAGEDRARAARGGASAPRPRAVAQGDRRGRGENAPVRGPAAAGRRGAGRGRAPAAKRPRSPISPSKRGELERALTAAEETWLDLASQVEAAG